MNNIATLAKMQLKEKLVSQKAGARTKAVSGTLLTVLTTLLKFVLSSAICFGLYTVAMVFSVFGTMAYVPDTFMTFLFTVLLMLSIASCTVRLTKALYFSRDNVILLTLPATPTQVFLSKIVVFFIFELKKNASFIIPVFVGYFLAHGHSFGFYPWLIICFIFISVFTIAVASLLSIPAAIITNFVRQRKSLQILITALSVIAVVVGLFLFVSVIPGELDLRVGWHTLGLQIQEFLMLFAEKISVIHDLTRMMIGEIIIGELSVTAVFPADVMLLRFGALLITSLALFMLSILVVKPIFYSMASKPFEYLKSLVKPKTNIVRSSKFTAIHSEFLKSAKDSARTATNIAIAVSIPMLSFVSNLIFSAMPTTEFGNKLIFACNLLLILLISLNSNSYAASIFSRDGRSAYLIKIQPKDPTLLLVAKLMPTTVFCFFSFVLTGTLLVSFSKLIITDVVFLMLGITFVYLAHLLYSAELDILNPHTEIYAAVGEYESDPNEIKSTSCAFVISFFTAALLFLLLFKEDIGYVCVKFAGVALLAFVYRAYLFISNIKLFYKEN